MSVLHLLLLRNINSWCHRVIVVVIGKKSAIHRGCYARNEISVEREIFSKSAAAMQRIAIVSVRTSALSSKLYASRCSRMDFENFMQCWGAMQRLNATCIFSLTKREATRSDWDWRFEERKKCKFNSRTESWKSFQTSPCIKHFNPLYNWVICCSFAIINHKFIYAISYLDDLIFCWRIDGSHRPLAQRLEENLWEFFLAKLRLESIGTISVELYGCLWNRKRHDSRRT